MASGAFSRGVLSILNGAIDADTTATKLGLAQSTYTPNKNESALTTFAASEATCTGYAGGFAGAGRKSAAITLTETAGTKVATIISDTTWTALGGATNNTLGYVVWLREITNDAASIPLAFLAFAATLTTNGSDVLVDFSASSNIDWSV